MADMINKPPHYNTGKIEVWDFITDQQMGYFDGNAVKYICRYRHKGNPVQDLDKAIAFLTKLRDTEYAKQEPKLLPNGTFDKAGTITLKPTPPARQVIEKGAWNYRVVPSPTPGVDEHVAQALRHNEKLKEANEEILAKQRDELRARDNKGVTYGYEVFKGPYNSYNLSPYDRS